MRFVGVDGCPAGWLCVFGDDESGVLTPAFQPSFRHIVEVYADATCVGIDIPIGLGEREPRRCDIEARLALGWPRRASVFPAPPRSLLRFADHRAATAASVERFGRGIAIQAFGIYRKVQDVDDVVTPELQDRVIEVHPEVSFWAMAGCRPMGHSKKTVAGFTERRDLLLQDFPRAGIPQTPADARQLAPCGGADDLFDAMATAWTARRFALGEARCLPEKTARDERGLRMEIVY